MTRLTVQAGGTRRLTRCAGSRAARALAVAAVGAFLLTSCAGSGVVPAPPVSPAALPATAWQRVLSQVGPDGSVSKQMALQAFVLAVGPLPGVARPAGPAQVIEDGSGAVRWLLGYYSELTAAQQAAVRRLLSLPVTASWQPARAGHGPDPATLDAAIRPAAPASPGPGQLAADQALEQQAAAEITSRLGVQLTLAVQVVENQTEQTVDGNPALAYTECTDATGGATGPAPAAKCKISINPSAHQVPGGGGGSYFKATMIHEVFHCFEAQLAGTIGRFNSALDAESWLMEGAAEWVASDFVTDPGTTGNWLDYLTHPATPLFGRTYDAIGWFGHLDPGGGVSPWKVLPAMIRAPGSAAAYNIATAHASAGFLDTEASVFFENSSLGRAWYQNGVQGQPPGTAAASAPPPGIWARYASPVQQVTVGTGQSDSLSAAPYADTVLSLQLPAQVTQITVITGHARLRSLTGTRDYVNPGTLYLCTASGPCSGCPAAASLPRFASPGDLALDGGPDRALVRVHGMSAKDLCDQPPAKSCDQFPDLGPPGTAITGGVPRTINGITALSCIYSQPKGFPYGWIIIQTFRSPAAAAAFFHHQIGGDPAPGFTEPVRYGESCSGSGNAEVCSTDEFALHGNRIDEVALQHPATSDLSLTHIGAFMRRVLAVT